MPNYVAFIPILKLYRNLGLNGTFPSVWLAHIGFGMSLAIYILRNYMATLPKTVIESAKIDGASHYQTFFRLVLPMSVPALASFAIFQFLWVWNDLLVALVFIGPGENEPVTVGLTHLKTAAGPGLGAHHRRWLPDHDRADHRVPGPAAVLRPRPHRGRREGLTPTPPATPGVPGRCLLPGRRASAPPGPLPASIPGDPPCCSPCRTARPARPTPGSSSTPPATGFPVVLWAGSRARSADLRRPRPVTARSRTAAAR